MVTASSKAQQRAWAKLARPREVTPDGWQILPDETRISPDGWKFSDMRFDETGELADYVALSPEGERYTRAEMEAPPELPEDYRLLYEEYQRTGGGLDPFSWMTGGAGLRPGVEEMPVDPGEMLSELKADPASFVRDLYLSRADAEAEMILGMLGVASDMVSRITEQVQAAGVEEARRTGIVQQVFPDFSVEDFVNLLEENPTLFLKVIQEPGETKAKVDLLSMLGYSQDEISQFIGAGQKTTATRVLEASWGEETLVKVADALDKPYKLVTNADIEAYLIEHPDVALEVEKWQKEHPPLTLFEEIGLMAESLKRIPKSLGASILQAMNPTGASVVNKGWGQRFIDEAKQDTQQFLEDVNRRYPDQPSMLGISAADIASLPENIAYSLASMGGGLAVGLPTALLPLPGARVAAYTLGSAVSGLVAFNMSKYQITQTFLEVKNEEKIAQTGDTLTIEEEEALKAEFNDLANKYGLWEAVPEAISNLGFVSLLTAPLSKIVGTGVAKGIVARLAGIYGEELLTETITQKGQAAVEIEAGLREGEISWVEAFKEIAPQTFLLTTILAGTGTAVVQAKTRIQASLKSEVGERGLVFDAITKGIEGFRGNLEELLAQPERGAIGREGKPIIPAVGDMVRVMGDIRKVTAVEVEADGSRMFRVEGLNQRVTERQVELVTRPEPGMAPSTSVQTGLPGMGVESRIEQTTPTGEVVQTIYTEAPAPTGGATARVFSRIQTDASEPGFTDKVKRGWDKFNIKMVDDLFPLKQITDQLKKGGVGLSIQENPYLLARLLKGVTSKATSFLEYGTFGKEFWKMEGKGRKARAVPNYTGESLQSILNEVKEPVRWQEFSTYLTSRRAVELSEREIETGIKVDDAKSAISELEEIHPDFDGLAQRVYKYQDSLLVYANEMGLISDDLVAKLRRYGNYVPFYRVFNELQAKGLMGNKMANIAAPIKRIKGSEREIINPLESIVKNTYVLINAADRNQVGIALANLVDQYPELADVFERVKTPITKVATVSAKELGVEVEGLTDAEEEQMVDIFRPSFFVSGDEVTVLIDGKRQYYRVDTDLRDAMLQLNRESLGMMGKILGAPARWLRAGATLSPDFMFRNPARDQLTAFAYSNYGFLPGIDFVKGIASILRKDSDYQLFRLSGAEHSMLVSMDRSYLRKTFNELVGGKQAIEYVRHPMELFRIVSELGEKATRLGEFRKGIQSGAIPLEAGYSGRSITLDFAQAGITAHAINTFIAFFNANLRGWGKMISSFKEHPVRTSAKVFIGITVPSMLFWLANHDDPRWKEIPQWQKDLFWIVFLGDNIYRIPKPFELGIIFGSVPERFLDWLVDRDPDLMKDLAGTLIESGSPGFIPTAALPIMEWMTNYSFFRGRSLVPASRQAMPPELQYTRWSSEVSKHLGNLLKQPPAKIDNLLFAWTGGLGRYATDILDGILKNTGISPDIPEPSPTLADQPVIKAFVVRSPYGSSGETVNDFYDTLEKYQAGEKSLKEMLVAGNTEAYERYKAAHPELLFFADFDAEEYQNAIEAGKTPKEVYYSASARYLRRVASELTELRKKQDLIYDDPSMSPEEKRSKVDEIDRLKTDVARKALDLLLGKEPTILKDRLDDAVNRLGQVIEEQTPLSLEKADIYSMRDLNREFSQVLEGVTIQDLEAMEGIDLIALKYLAKEEVEDTVEPILGREVYRLDFNLKEGVTFEDYHRQWQAGLTVDSPLDNLSWRQVALLRDYHRIEDDEAKREYLVGLSEEDRHLLTQNPRDEWLRSHPQENALLALFGQEKILTPEAYTAFRALVDELDIPNAGLPEMTLPPETSMDTHFTYQEFVGEGKHGSWEAQLLLLKDAQTAEEAGVQSYAEWAELTLSDTPVEALELKVKNREAFEKPAGERTPEDKAVLRRVEAIEKNGTEYQDAWVERGTVIDEYGSNSAQGNLWLLENPKVYQWAIETGLLTDRFDDLKEREPILRLDVRLEQEPDNARLKYQRQAYTDKVPESFHKDYVDWYTLPTLKRPEDWQDKTRQDRWYEDDWYLMEHKAFYEKVYLGVLGNQERDFSKVPTRTVFLMWLEYNQIDADNRSERMQYRLDNTDLDDWGQLAGIWTAPAGKPQETTTARKTPSTTTRKTTKGSQAFGERLEEGLSELEDLLR